MKDACILSNYSTYLGCVLSHDPAAQTSCPLTNSGSKKGVTLLGVFLVTLAMTALGSTIG